MRTSSWFNTSEISDNDLPAGDTNILMSSANNIYDSHSDILEMPLTYNTNKILILLGHQLRHCLFSNFYYYSLHIFFDLLINPLSKAMIYHKYHIPIQFALQYIMRDSIKRTRQINKLSITNSAFSIASWNWFTMVWIAISVDLFVLKPNWNLQRILCLPK
jgi:hypothetical protein